MNRKAIEYSVLERDVESSRQIYDSLMQRAKETSVAGELKSSNIRVVDRAEVPRQPVSPRALSACCSRCSAARILACGIGVLLRVSRQPHQVAGGDRSVSRPAVDRHDSGARQELARCGAADHQRRPAELRRGVQGASHQRAVLRRREGLPRDRRHQHRARRGQDDGGEQPGDRRSPMPASACC